MSKKEPADAEEFLAAPESVTKSEEETAKYKRRKAIQAAEEQRLKNSKSKEPASDEDLLADMIRVANDEETNPQGFRFSTLSRKRYREFGNWYVEEVDKRWGQFQHALEVAGLREKPGTRAQKRARSARSRDAHAARYQERYLRPYHHTPNQRIENGVELMLSISDTHATFLDPFTWWCFLRAVKDLKPDYIVLNGDILEGAEISTHLKIPGWTVPLQLEFDFTRVMFEQLRTIAPDTEIWWMAGNHGLDRLARYLTQQAPALANLRDMRFDKLAGLDDLDIKLSQGGTIASPEGTEGDPEGELFGGFYRVYHGRALGRTPALTELQNARRSGQSGHVHRAHLIYGTSEADGATSWMTTPMGCTDRAGRAYMKGPTTGWQKGFGVAWLHEGGRVQQYPVVTSDGVAVFEGILIEDPGMEEPDPNKLWLPDMEVPS